MSKWSKRIILKETDPEKFEPKNYSKSGIICEAVSCCINPFQPTDIDKKIAEDRRRSILQESLQEQDMWMYHYHLHLKNMYAILMNNLKKLNIQSGLSFDEFRIYVYDCTLTQIDSCTHKRIRPLD